jgi:hypothetical protein
LLSSSRQHTCKSLIKQGQRGVPLVRDRRLGLIRPIMSTCIHFLLLFQHLGSSSSSRVIVSTRLLLSSSSLCCFSGSSTTNGGSGGVSREDRVFASIIFDKITKRNEYAFRAQLNAIFMGCDRPRRFSRIKVVFEPLSSLKKSLSTHFFLSREKINRTRRF